MQIQTNLINGSWNAGIKKLLFLGSSCIYPKNSTQPIKEEYLLSGQLEKTNEPYAVSKIAGIKMCESYNREFGTDYRSIMPSNLYGPGDNYHEMNSHVIPALIQRFHEAKEKIKMIFMYGVQVDQKRILYVDDLAEACRFIMDISKKNMIQSHPRCAHI